MFTHQIISRSLQLLRVTAVLFVTVSIVNSAPEITITKNKTESTIDFNAEGKNLPECRALSLSGTYTFPHSTIASSIVSSPLPSTLSASLDTAASSLSITIKATGSTITPGANCVFIILSVPVASEDENGDVAFTKAISTKKDNTTEEITINCVLAGRPFDLQPFSMHTVPGDASRHKSPFLFTLNGQRVSRATAPRTNGCYIIRATNNTNYTSRSVITFKQP